jgi:hypothetical protein
MRIDNSFEVPLPTKDAWKVLLDIERIVPCMPGAELTGVVDGRTYKGKASVRLGPVTLAFAGQVRFEEVDDDNHTARAKAQGKDSKGRGGANATVDFHVEPTANGSRVNVSTDLMLSGAVAQYGRASGLVQGVAAELIGQFAKNLQAQLQRPPDKGSEEPPEIHAATPISAFSLIWTMLRKAVLRIVGRSVKN